MYLHDSFEVCRHSDCYEKLTDHEYSVGDCFCHNENNFTECYGKVHGKQYTTNKNITIFHCVIYKVMGGYVRKWGKDLTLTELQHMFTPIDEDTYKRELIKFTLKNQS